MSLRLISRSPDLKKLWDEGYDVEIRAAYLLVKKVPYVTAEKKVKLGTLVAALRMAGDIAERPEDHTIMFTGEYPCRPDGSPIETIRHASARQELDRGLVIDHKFSNKPPAGYSDFYEKMTTYVNILANQAKSIDPSATARVNLFVEAPDEESVFRYLDTASSSAGITAVGRKLEKENVAIVGLGGTGSYVLDLLAKTPIKQIHLFDGEPFLSHNAFRSPGAASVEELRASPMKVEYFASTYASMRRGIVPHDYHLNASNREELKAMDFVFLCFDTGYAKKDLIEKLLEWKVPFIDVGMGVELIDGALGGILRVTAITPEKQDHVQRIPVSDADVNDDYSTRIQIADLNALNASLAVIKWKKYYGFYRDSGREHHIIYTIDVNSMINEEVA